MAIHDINDQRAAVEGEVATGFVLGKTETQLDGNALPAQSPDCELAQTF